MSRFTVQRIANEFKQHDPTFQPEKQPSRRYVGKQLRRCKTCGAIVEMPCLACLARSVNSKRTTFFEPVLGEQDTLELRLRPQEQVRYEHIRASRERH